MPSDVFFDSNVIVYFSFDDGVKTARSDALVRSGGIVSVQVLNEFARVSVGKRKLSFAELHKALDAIKATCTIVPVTLETHKLGLSYAERYKIGVFDSMIVAAAVLAGCTTLYTEDMHDGLIIDGLTIRNPFPAA